MKITPNVRAVFMLDPEIKRALRMAAASRECKMSQIVNEALRAKLKPKTEAKTA